MFGMNLDLSLWLVLGWSEFDLGLDLGLGLGYGLDLWSYLGLG